MRAFFRKWRRFTAVGFALVFLGLGVPYLFFRQATRGRFLSVAAAMERELAMGRGSGADGPTEDEVRARVLALAEARSVDIDGLTVTRVLPSASDPSIPPGSVGYVVEGEMRTTYRGLEVTAPLGGMLTVRVGGPPP